MNTVTPRGSPIIASLAAAPRHPRRSTRSRAQSQAVRDTVPSLLCCSAQRAHARAAVPTGCSGLRGSKSSTDLRRRSTQSQAPSTACLQLAAASSMSSRARARKSADSSAAASRRRAGMPRARCRAAPQLAMSSTSRSTTFEKLTLETTPLLPAKGAVLLQILVGPAELRDPENSLPRLSQLGKACAHSRVRQDGLSKARMAAAASSGASCATQWPTPSK
jgi:hypothetical protein